MIRIIKNFLLIILIIKRTFQTVSLGDCGKIGYKAENFDSCKGKDPYDDTKYCCYLESRKYKECVEILKEDIDDGEVAMTIKAIEKGTYENWINDNGDDLNRDYGDIDSLECDKNSFLKLNFFFLFFLIYVNIKL